MSIDIDVESEPVGGRNQPLISARGLTRVYSMARSQVVGVNAIDMDIGNGQLVVLRGNSGSGKSTLLSLLAGLDHPTSGTLLVGGVDLATASDRELTRFRREKIGMVFQSFNLLPTLDVLENTCLPAFFAGKPVAQTREKGKGLLDWLGLAPRLNHLPAQLSGGEMQRTAIARALINDPDIILADEPTGNLDSHNAETVIQLLAKLHQESDRTIIIATHSSLADPLATMRVLMKDGEISIS
ncbi:MAG: ABC transporter ATP-binding protein [Deltaproteobacteria bacterium]|nr:ABC transporter ATP-binding protein [Deltaproteobacteria bacterium]